MVSAPALTESELRGATGVIGPVPKHVAMSFWLWIAASVMSVIGSLLMFGRRDEMREAFRTQQGTEQLTQAQLDTLVTATVVIGVVVSVVLSALYVLFAFKARAGRNWARVVLLILTAFSVVMLALAGGFSWLGMLATLVSLVAVVLLFLPAANAYFASARRTA